MDRTRRCGWIALRWITKICEQRWDRVWGMRPGRRQGCVWLSHYIGSGSCAATSPRGLLGWRGDSLDLDSSQALSGRRRSLRLGILRGVSATTQGRQPCITRVCLCLVELGDKSSLTEALWFSGISAIQRGEYGQAAALYGECLQLARQSQQEQYVAAVLAEQGFMGQLEGDYERAARLYEESLALFRQLGDTWHIAYCFRLLTLCRSLKEKWVTIECLEGLAGIAARLGRPERAAHLFGAADNVRQVIGLSLNPWEQSEHERDIALVRTTLGKAISSVAWAEGQAMGLEQAVDSGLSEET